MSREMDLASDFIDSLEVDHNRPGGTAWIRNKDDAKARLAVVLQMAGATKNLWLPIDYLVDRYAQNLLLRAPELYDADCNPHGVSPGFWQDGGNSEDPVENGGAWITAGYDMNNDEFMNLVCNPTHYMIIEGPTSFTDAEVDAANAAGNERYIRRMTTMQAPSMGMTADESYNSYMKRFGPYAFDDRAKLIYDTWSDHTGWVPWVENGNSDKQNEARRIARSEAYENEEGT